MSTITLDEKIEFFNVNIDALNSQLESLNLKIIFDYEIKFLDEDETISDIDSCIFSLINSENVVLCEFENTEGFDRLQKITDWVVQFIEYITDEVREHIEVNNTDMLYIVHECDVWQSSSSMNFKGVFTSMIEAFIAIQISNAVVLTEESGMYKPVSTDFYNERNLDGVRIEPITLNELQ
jgi:hypothetical protein